MEVKKNMADEYSIMCFSWNAAGLKICESMSQDKADKKRKGFKAFIMRKKDCVAPDFFEEIRNMILQKSPKLVVITTQNEDSVNTYFHSDFLPNIMSEINYTLVKRDKMYGIGDKQTKVPTGTTSGSALRVSIYSSNDDIENIITQEKELSKHFSNQGQIEAECTRGKRKTGAIASYIWHRIYGKLCFITLDFTLSDDYINLTNLKSYQLYRAAIRSSNNLCLIAILNKFVDSLEPGIVPDNVFLLGNFNYDINPGNEDPVSILNKLAKNFTVSNLSDYVKKDELTISKDSLPLSNFKEGVDDKGPLFMPTWKLLRNRREVCSPVQHSSSSSSPSSFPEACFDDPTSGFGWHDRILYSKQPIHSNYVPVCTYYNRFDFLNINQSTNAGVIGIFELKSV